MPPPREFLADHWNFSSYCCGSPQQEEKRFLHLASRAWWCSLSGGTTRSSGKSLLPTQGSKRDPAGFQINRQKPQALIHTEKHLGEENTQGKPLSSDFYRHFIRHQGGWSLSQFNSMDFMAHHAGEDTVNTSKISDHLSDGKRPMTQSRASGRCVWTHTMKNPVVSDIATFGITRYYST